MSKFLWILGLATLGTAVYVLLSDENDGLTADEWGTKQRVKGTGGVLGGKVEQGLGKLTGDPAVQGKGVLDETVGQVKDAAGKAAHAVSDAFDSAKS